MRHREGDIVAHNLDPTIRLRVLRAELDSLGGEALVVCEVGDPSGASFRVRGFEVTTVYATDPTTGGEDR